MKDKIKERLQKLYNECGEHDPLKTYYRGRLKQHHETLQEVKEELELESRQHKKALETIGLMSNEIDKIKEELEKIIKHKDNPKISKEDIIFMLMEMKNENA